MRFGVLGVSIVLLLAACGESPSGSSRSDAGSAAALGSPTNAATSTVPTAPEPASPSATQTGSGEWPSVSTACAGASDEPLLLVALGTSETSSDDAYPLQYAQILCEELGTTVELHRFYPDDLGPLSWWRERLESDRRLRGDLASADIVALWALASHDVVPTFFYGTCTGDWPGPLRDCIERTVAPIPELLDDVHGAIAELVGDDAIVLAADGFTPPAVLNRWGDEPYWTELHAMLDPAAATTTAALAHGFTVVPTEIALNGPTRVARLDAALIQGDGLHLTSEGQAVVAEAFAAADGLGG